MLRHSVDIQSNTRPRDHGRMSSDPEAWRCRRRPVQVPHRLRTKARMRSGVEQHRHVFLLQEEVRCRSQLPETSELSRALRAVRSVQSGTRPSVLAAERLGRYFPPIGHSSQSKARAKLCLAR